MTGTPIFINGRFASQKVTGVQRYAREIVAALDAELVARRSERAVTLLLPPGVACDLPLSHIRVENRGRLRGHAWEQVDLAAAVGAGFLVNLCNSGPVSRTNQLTVIHDAAVYRFPRNYSRAYGIFHRLLGRLLSRRSRLATVSVFSRGELAAIFGVDPAGIAVLANGGDHISRITPDDRVIDRLDLTDRPYFLFVGTPAPNKNLPLALRAFARCAAPQSRFVIVGASSSAIYGEGIGALPEGVIMPGRLSDEEVVALYRHARALVFPSLYEGFGIPPLEAFQLNCPVIASDIPPIREVCGDAAVYVAPTDEAGMATAMRRALETAPAIVDRAAADRFTWRASASRLLDMLPA